MRPSRTRRHGAMRSVQSLFVLLLLLCIAVLFQRATAFPAPAVAPSDRSVRAAVDILRERRFRVSAVAGEPTSAPVEETEEGEEGFLTIDTAVPLEGGASKRSLGIRCLLPPGSAFHAFPYGGYGGAGVAIPKKAHKVKMGEEASSEAAANVGTGATGGRGGEAEEAKEVDEDASAKAAAAILHRGWERLRAQHSKQTASAAKEAPPLCVYRHEGWWTYEVCMGKSIRQFHLEVGKPANPDLSFFLGNQPAESERREADKYDPVASDLHLTEHPKYFVERYDSGTVCDLTGRPRRAQVRYQCNPERSTPFIVDITEPAACEYVVTVQTALLCQHPAFVPPASSVQDIRCFSTGKVFEDVPSQEEHPDAPFMPRIDLMPPVPKLDLRDPYGRRPTALDDRKEQFDDETLVAGKLATALELQKSSGGIRATQFSSASTETDESQESQDAQMKRTLELFTKALNGLLDQQSKQANRADRDIDTKNDEHSLGTDDHDDAVVAGDDDDDEVEVDDAENNDAYNGDSEIEVVWVDGAASSADRQRIQELLAAAALAAGNAGDDTQNEEDEREAPEHVRD